MICLLRYPERSATIGSFLQASFGEFIFAETEIREMRKVGRDGLKPPVLGEDIADLGVFVFFHVEREH